MNKWIFFIFLFCTLAIIFAVRVYSYKTTMKNDDLSFTKGSNYEKDWAKVDSLINQGLTKSALEIVTTIYTKAKAENNAAQFVKAIIHRMKLESQFEEYSLEKSIYALNEEIKTTHYPITPVLHSILAESYWKYYENNRWEIYERTKTVGFKNDDIATWDINQLVDQVIKHYQLSLESSDSLKRTPLNIYDAILHKEPDSRKFRPTLYDLLAHRAVDFYMNQEPEITKPANTFALNEQDYFSTNSVFAKKDVVTKDSMSLKYYATRILQDLIAFHLNDKEPDALIDTDLKRLSFINKNSTLSNKDSLYLDALEQLEKKYIQHPSSTEITYEIANHYFIQGGQYYLNDAEEFKWDRKKAHEICQSAINRFPDSYGAKNCKHLQSKIEEKQISFAIEDVNVANKAFRALFHFQNVKKIYVRIARLDEDLNKKQREYDHEAIVKNYKALKPVAEFTTELPNDGDYLTHHVEIKMPTLPLGQYIILAGTDEKFATNEHAVAYEKCWVSNISYVTRRAQNGSYESYVFDRESGNPLKGVTAQLWYEKYNYNSSRTDIIKAESFITNEDGYFKVGPNSEYRNYFIEFTYKSDRLYTNNGIYLYQNYTNEQRKQARTFFFTDRAIYRPGQTVHFKGIVLETDGDKNNILPKKSTTITFYDVNHQKVSSLDLITNEYGTFNGTFVAPQGLINGQMHIANESGSLYFSVEDYKRPKFEVTIMPVKGSYKLGESIKVEGVAKSYSGANVDGAEVKYRVVRAINFPWWYRRYYSFDQTEITNGTSVTNDTGGFVINFIALPDLSISKIDQPTYNFTIYADVTDINGETHSSEVYVSVAYRALNLEINIQDKINKEIKEFKLPISTSNLNGEFEPASGKIQIYKLNEPKAILRRNYWEKVDKFLMTKEEYKVLFPNDIYSGEDDMLKWTKGNKVLDENFDTQKSKELILQNISSWQQGYYVMEALTKDKFGEEVKDIKHFTVFSDKGKNVPVITPDWFTTLNDNGEPGEKARFLIGSSHEKIKVLYEIEHKNVIVKKEWITVSNEQKLIEITIEEKHRGNFAAHFTFVVNSRCYQHDVVINVPYTNKELDITFESFRNKLLPGQQEEWKIKIKDKKGEKIAAEMLATMYDASLDAFIPHNWYFDIYTSYYASLNWYANTGFKAENSSLLAHDWNEYPGLINREYETLNWFGFYHYGGYPGQRYKSEGLLSRVQSAPMMDAMQVEEVSAAKANTLIPAPMEKEQDSNAQKKKDADDKPKETDLSAVSTRKNFNETAFFYPNLETNEKGEVIIKFTIPEALTKWKMMGLAHTKDLKYGQVTNELVTQKELMVVPNAPRFFRENDQITFTTKISNLSDKDLSGKTELILYDAITMNVITHKVMFAVHGQFETIGTRNFTVKKGLSTLVSWDITIPEGINAITYKVIAKGDNHSDGEEMTIPVLTNKMLVTESMPLPIRGNQTKTFNFTKLLSQSNGSTTLRNHKLTLEFSSNPAWYAIQALPYLMEYPYECAEQTFSRYYANSIASHIANSSPKIKAVFDSWRSQSPDALLSNLEKNQELKTLMLEETPWVLQAKNESERKKRVALLFDLNKMGNELNKALNKLQKMQVSSGAWPWFEGMSEDRYITQHIISGMGHLDRLGVKNVREDQATWSMIGKAVHYMDSKMQEDYIGLKKRKELERNNLGYSEIHYLYARSYFKDIPVSKNYQEAFDYYKGLAQKHWLSNSRYMQGMIALSLHRFDDKKIPASIVRSLKENSITSEEMGMYWKENYEGYYWYQAPIESQALMVEVFDEVANDKKSVDDLKVWLLKSKQTQDWKTTKATTEACYALLLRGTQWLESDVSVDITLGDIKVDPKKMDNVKVEAGTGYFKTSWSGSDIKPAMGKVTVSKPNEGVSWGSLYWQYFEQLDKITPHETPLKLNKKLFLEVKTDAGLVIKPIEEKTQLAPGDKIKVRIELRVDRDMEYVQMKDMRASGFEPLNVFSGYRWQGGLGYYETTRDAATNFFFSYLPKGTYVFEYPLVVTHNGDFSNGISSIQCMYAPEFTSHSAGIRVKVGK